MGLNETLTSTNNEEELCPPWYSLIFRVWIVHKKLTVIATGVRDPQLRDGHVQEVVLGVSTDSRAFLVITVVHAELILGVHV